MWTETRGLVSLLNLKLKVVVSYTAWLISMKLESSIRTVCALSSRTVSLAQELGCSSLYNSTILATCSLCTFGPPGCCSWLCSLLSVNSPLSLLAYPIRVMSTLASPRCPTSILAFPIGHWFLN